MPYGKKKFYKRRPYRKRRYRRKYKKKSVYKIAQSAARQVLLANTTANWTQDIIGSYAAATGQWSNPQTILPGPDQGNFIPGPLISRDPDQPGVVGYRVDNKIILKAIKVRLRFDMPDGVDTAFFNVYLAQCKNGNLLSSNFNTPDQVSMLRNDAVDIQDRYAIKMLVTKRVKMNAKSTDVNPLRDVNIYYRFKKPVTIEYDGPLKNDWLNKQFAVCIKASYQYASPASEKCTVVGAIQYYYRDLN